MSTAEPIDTADDKLIKLARSVREMRDWQKKYFRERDSRTLEICKIKEREVDSHVAKLLSQPTLF
jgi:hypothetical protein